MAEIHITIDGDLNADLLQALKKVSNAVVGPLVEEASMIQANSKEIVPVDEGILRASADEVGVNIDQDDFSATVTVGYGGAASAYAVEQHENPEYRHAEGKTWKYLEKPALEAVDGMGQRLAEGMRRRLSDLA